MFFLPDVALMLVSVLMLMAFGWAISEAGAPWMRATLWPGAALLAVTGTACWALGSLGFYAPIWWGAALWGVCSLAIALRWRRVAERARVLARIGPQGASGAWLWGVLTALCCLGALILALAPPIGTDYDSLVYHLAAPAQYARAGAVVELPYDHHTYFPFLFEMLYGIGLEVRGPVLAKLVHWLMLPLCGVAIAAITLELARRQGVPSNRSRTAAAAGALLFVSMPMALGQATTAYIDLGFTAFATLAVWAMLAALHEAQTSAPIQDEARGESGALDARRAGIEGLPARAALAWSGVFCGACLGSKYFGALIFGFLGLWLLFEIARARRVDTRERFGRRAWECVLWFAVPALVLGAPWYVRNWIWTGNPVFPFAFEIFGGRGWTLEMARLYALDQASFGFGRAPLDLLWLPWRLMMTPLATSANDGGLFGLPFWPFAVGAAPEGKIGLFDVRVPSVLFQSFPGPLVVLAGLGGLLAPRKGRGAGLLFWFALFLLAFWFLTSQQIRYLFPVFALVSVLAALAWARRTRPLPLTRLAAGLLLGVWALLALAVTVHRHSMMLPVIAGRVTPEAFVTRYWSGDPAMRWIAANTPPDARVAVYGEPRGFYLPRDYFWADPQHNRLVDPDLGRTGDGLASELRRLGATHVLHNTTPSLNGGVFGPPEGWTEMIERGHIVLLFEARAYRVWQLRPAPAQTTLSN